MTFEQVENVFQDAELLLLYGALGLSAGLSAGSQRHLKEGFARRVYIMRTNREAMLDIAPTGRTEALQGNEPEMLNVHLNSYYIHLRGAFDNLAWALQYEFAPLGSGGEEIPAHWMKCNLFDNRFVGPLTALKPELGATLQASVEWATGLKDRRDPVAHRVPLYVPPGVVRGEEGDRAKALFAEASLAYEAGDLRAGMAKVREGYAIGQFTPVMVLSGTGGLTVLKLNETVQRDHATFLTVSKAVLNGLGIETG
jgi:hypothetical protein